MSEPRFLVVRLSSLGDIVHTFPAVAALRESFPSSEIVWLTHPRWNHLVESSGLANEIWATDTRSLKALREVIGRIRQKTFDTSIDYQGLWKSAGISFLAGVKHRIGFSSDTIREFGVPLLYTDRVHCKSIHIVEQNGELSQHAGTKNKTAAVTLRTSPDDEANVSANLKSMGIEQYVVLSPGGGWRSKCWPAERFGALCRKIREMLHLRCVVNFGPGEESLAAAVQQASGDADPLLYNGKLGSLMALLRNARCIVGGDTGPLHLAVALGAPSVAIFGPTDPARNGTYRSKNALTQKDILLRSANAITTYKRGKDTDVSLFEISVDSVFAAVVQLLGASA